MNLVSCGYTPKRVRIEESGIINAVYITASLNNFDKTHSWQDSYFHLLSWKNTWFIPLEVDMHSTRSGPYVKIVIPDNKDAEFLEHTLNMMEDLGYREINHKPVRIMLIKPEWNYEDNISDFMINPDF